MRQTGFGVYLNDDEITSLPVSSKDAIGISMKGVTIPGMVTMFEEHDARIEAKYNLIEWYTISGLERALEVSHYRIRRAIEYQKSVAEQKLMKSKG